ncbi:MAG: ABC transporter substrate-binding protein [Cytophagaceae bacterium]|nr:ABC transporter substrate-binding protein [Cytophagaceae bacterium]
MRKVLVSLLCASLFLYSCTPQPDGSDDPTTLREVKGGKYYGGLFKLNESDYFKNLFPHNINDAISYRIATQIYEGLVKFNPDNLELVPSIAESFSQDTSQTVYTFKIRKGVMFHDNECFPGGKGREVTADDIKFCFTLLCTDHVNNQGYSAVFKGILKGADAYYTASAGGKKPNFELEGVKVVDKYTVQLILSQPTSIFLYNLAKPYSFIFPKEAYEKYDVDMRTKAVGTGPFVIDRIDEGNAVILKKNVSYYLSDENGNKLPYLSGIKIRFMKDKKSELLEFKKGNLDMMYRMPTDHIIEIEEEATQKKGQYGKYDLQRTPELATHFLLFLNSGKIFGNRNVRKAFSYAINRNYILEAILNGEGFGPAIYGITPPAFAEKGYDIRNIKGYDYNVDSAKYYLRKAGYSDGKDFPRVKLQLNSDGERNVAVAEEVQKQLREGLGVQIDIEVVPLAQLLENMQTGKADFARGGWLADYPNPENFLWFFYGKNVPSDQNKISYPNMMRYQNPEFDKYYEMGIRAKTQEEAFKYFMMAENIMIQDAPIIVLWYDEGYRLVQPNIKNFPNNAMQYRDFTKVYMVPGKKAS